MHPEPTHLKNFARNTQWSRGKKVLNRAFLNRFQRPGLERLLACHVPNHLTRAIGHHIDRLAWRSVTIMGCLPACLSETLWNNPGTGVKVSVGYAPLVAASPVRSRATKQSGHRAAHRHKRLRPDLGHRPLAVPPPNRLGGLGLVSLTNAGRHASSVGEAARAMVGEL
jgi:hypothetical protein